MHKTLHRVALLSLGIVGTVCAALAAVLLVLWILDQSGDVVSRELALSICLAIVAAACALGRRLLQRPDARARDAAVTGGDSR